MTGQQFFPGQMTEQEIKAAWPHKFPAPEGGDIIAWRIDPSHGSTYAAMRFWRDSELVVYSLTTDHTYRVDPEDVQRVYRELPERPAEVWLRHKDALEFGLAAGFKKPVITQTFGMLRRLVAYPWPCADPSRFKSLNGRHGWLLEKSSFLEYFAEHDTKHLELHIWGPKSDEFLRAWVKHLESDDFVNTK